MYVIKMKKINQATALPVMCSQQTTSLKMARKYRDINIADADFIICKSNYPQFLWQVCDTKTGEVLRSSAREVLPIWNKMLGRAS